MPFLTKGKTNWKFIGIVLILAILVGGGIFGYLKYFEREIESFSKFPEIKKPEKVIKEETTNWKTYSNPVYNIELKYPSDWQLREEIAFTHKYEGDDGFFQISVISGENLTIDEVCENEAYHKLKPYGSQPKIQKLEVQNQEACLILPSNDQSKPMKNQSALIVKYPQPIEIKKLGSYNYFILWADRDHVKKIIKTLKFIKDKTTNWKTYKNGKYGFEFKYPPDSEICGDFSLKTKANVFCRKFSLPTEERYQKYGHTIQFGVDILEKEELEETVKHLKNWAKGKIIFNGIEFDFYEDDGALVGMESWAPLYYYITDTKEKNKEIVFWIAGFYRAKYCEQCFKKETLRSILNEVYAAGPARNHCEKCKGDLLMKKVEQETINKILSTFRFLE
jgi:TolB protein